MKIYNKLLFLILFLGSLIVNAQFTISGKITDAETGDGLPFVNIYFTGTNIGITTNFEGFFTISAPQKYDSLSASYIGYNSKTKAVGIQKIINFQLFPSSTALEAIEVVAGENPAWEIMRKVIKNKDQNDPRSIPEYNFESYTKVEFDVDNLNEKLKKKLAVRPFKKILDSVKLIAGDEGKMILPIYISETISRFYVKNSPYLTKEVIEASNINGIGMGDGGLYSQLAGTSFQQYNFYKNWLAILEKNFVSPISIGWKSSYDYYLIDSLMIDKRWCYKIDVEPKRKQDLAFVGTIWIDAQDYALKQLDLKVTKDANINYIEKIKIQQQFIKTKEGKWMIEKSRIMIEVEKINEEWVGMIAKFYTSNKDFNLNNQQESSFYEENLEIDKNALKKNIEFWVENRHDSLSETELAVYSLVDSIKNIPAVRTYVDIAEMMIRGYKKIGILDIGPYLFLYNLNNIEGHRIRLGGRTNIDFSNKLVFKSYLAYGTTDQKIKHLANVRYIFNRNKWTQLEIQSNSDIVQLGLIEEEQTDGNLFMAFANFGTLSQPFYFKQHHIAFQTDVANGYIQKIRLQNKQFDAAYPFAYYQNVNDNSSIKEQFNVSEVEFTSIFSRRKKYIQSGNMRYSYGNSKYPTLTLAYTHGFKNVFNSDFNYDKVSANLSQQARMGKLGIVKYSLTAGKIYSPVPYPLLKVHLGNETFFHNQLSFNLMNYFEFVSDQYVSLIYQHHFMGQILNRIPLMKKLKWRLLGDVNILYGTLNQSNRDIIANNTIFGEPITAQFGSLSGRKPYVEVGYGIENIFRVLRIEAMHRLTYYDNTTVVNADYIKKANRFGIRIALQFEL